MNMESDSLFPVDGGFTWFRVNRTYVRIGVGGEAEMGVCVLGILSVGCGGRWVSVT